MELLTEPEPARGVPLPVLPGISRIVAPNPGPMTYHGTNTWLIEEEGGLTVLDPGPDDAVHVAAILAAAPRIGRILLTHAHRDHIGALAALRAASGAPVFAFAGAAAPDHPLAEADAVGAWRVLHTPGHAADHLCFARADGVVFSGDHVMGWSTSVVGPPQGDMAAYMAGLARLLDRDDQVFLCGHGPLIAAPRTPPGAHVAALLAHRQQREAMVLAALAAGAATPREIVGVVYAGLAPRLVAAAERNVAAHLAKLEAEGRAEEREGLWRAR